MNRLDRTVSNTLLFLVVVGWTPATLALEPPDSEINRATGSIESVSAVIVDSQYDVRYVVDPGQGAPTVYSTIADSSDDDLAPRISIGTGGEVSIVWWRDGTTAEIWVRGRGSSPGGWSTAERVSAEGVDSRRPGIVYDGTDFWVVFEYDDSSGDTGIAVRGVLDDFEPFGQLFEIGVADTGGDVDSQVHFTDDTLWVSWVDSELEVGWSVYDYTEESWSLPQYETVLDGDVAAARVQIRDDVLGN